MAKIKSKFFGLIIYRNGVFNSVSIREVAAKYKISNLQNQLKELFSEKPEDDYILFELNKVTFYVSKGSGDFVTTFDTIGSTFDLNTDSRKIDAKVKSILEDLASTGTSEAFNNFLVLAGHKDSDEFESLFDIEEDFYSSVLLDYEEGPERLSYYKGMTRNPDLYKTEAYFDDMFVWGKFPW